jgi:dienelactone hydrolase
MAETFPPETLKTGIPGDEAGCKRSPNTVWVMANGAGDCIRYYPAGLSSGVNESVVIVIGGDRLVAVEGGSAPDAAVAYNDNSAEAQQAKAEAYSHEVGLPVVVVARPGLYRSTGNHSRRRRAREMKLMDGAIAEIVKRERIQKIGLTGQSGGGTVASYVLTRQRNLRCVTLTSAELSMHAILQTSAASHYDGTHAGELYNPIDHVAEVEANTDRDVFVIWSQGDRYSPPENQHAYAQALRALRHKVHVIEGEAVGASRHTLDRTGRTVTAWCLKGIAADEIEVRIRSQEVKG